MVEHEDYREMALLFARFRAIYVLPKRTSERTKIEMLMKGAMNDAEI